jgi:hypothetical protein
MFVKMLLNVPVLPGGAVDLSTMHRERAVGPMHYIIYFVRAHDFFYMTQMIIYSNTARKVVIVSRSKKIFYLYTKSILYIRMLTSSIILFYFGLRILRSGDVHSNTVPQGNSDLKSISTLDWYKMD